MAAMLANPRAAFVQTRIEWGNGERNWLTRAQRLMQDAHFAVEQDVRARRGVPFQFNGTGGIWRRAAVEEAGGWSHDTLSEDLDLVLRTHLKGWDGVFLMEPHVVGELPQKLDDFSAQQSRWSKGFVQVARKLLPPIWKSDWPAEAKLTTTVALGQQLIFPVAGRRRRGARRCRSWATAICWAASASCLWLWLAGHAGGAVRHDLGRLSPAGRGELARYLVTAASVPALIVYLAVANAGAIVGAGFGKKTEFNRTPKTGRPERSMAILIATLACFFAAVFAVCCVLLAAFIGSLLYMVVLHHRLKAAGLAREEMLLATPLPPDAELPHVVVQIPSFNEGAGGAARRRSGRGARLAARQAAHPAPRRQHRRDGRAWSRAVAAELRGQGLRRRGAAAHRPQRLQGRGAARGDAADAARFLRDLRRRLRAAGRTSCAAACAPFFAEPKTAFVQARFDFLNPHENALTEMQMVTLDAHLGIEQATRCWAGHPLPFNGTCGIWQRAAIEAGGGWKGDTVTEDLDLTYRGWVKGWRALFLTSVGVPGELPADTQTWLRQQQRWQDGFRHVSLRMFPEILKSRDIAPSAKARGAAASLHVAQPAGAAGRRRVRPPGGAAGAVAGAAAADAVRRHRGLGDVLCHDLPARRPQLHPRRRDAAAGRFAVVLLRFVGGQVAMVVRSLSCTEASRRPSRSSSTARQEGRMSTQAQAGRRSTARRKKGACLARRVGTSAAARFRAAADGGRSAGRRRG